MNLATATWLRGQVEAVRVLAKHVQETVNHHSPRAATEMYDVLYACNRANAIIQKAAETEGD